MTKHNKKRNIGIMYELLLRHISSCLIEANKNSAKIATDIIEHRFAKDTEIYKEFRLFNALARTSVENTEVAAAILTEAKGAARRFDQKKLESEKSSLIKDINYKIKDKKFYYRSVPDYREYANIHNMIREWQKKDRSDLKSMVILEQKALNHLMKQKTEDTISQVKEQVDVSQSNVLVERIMSQKLNDKYSNFSNSQREIIQKYVLYTKDDADRDMLKSYLAEKKQQTLAALSGFSKINDNQYVGERISLVENKINKLDLNSLDDKTVSKFLTLTKLVEEIESGE